MADIKVPTVGESITEVIIAQWLKPEGAAVTKDEPIVALETDKVNVEVLAPATGVLEKIVKQNNDTAAIDEVIGRVKEGATAAAEAPSAAPKADAPKPDAPKPEAPKPEAPKAHGSSGGHVMPAAERVMAQNNLPHGSVQGSGPGGRVLKEDAQRASGGQGASAPQAPAPKAAPPMVRAPQFDGNNASLEEVVPMTPMRRRIAERLVQVQHTAAILTTFNEVDMTAVMQIRKQYQDIFVKRYGMKLGFMSFFVKAAIDALRLVPEVNAEIRGNDLVYKNYCDIGVAVGGERGLVVPVVRKAELLSFAELEQTISEYATRANAGKLKLEELQGGTFTISNGGVYGSLMSTPILNPPQSGILGMHSIVERPVGIDGKVELRPMMYIALSYDHRVVDGRGAVTFLKRIKECIEQPHRMLVEV